MKTIAFLAACLAIPFADSAAFAASDFAGCPPVLETSETLVGNYPGWTATDTTGTHALFGINVYLHNPSQNTRMMPAQIELGDRTLYNYWDIDDPDFWMVCSYQGTSVRIGKIIPKGKTICAEKYDQSKSLEFIACR